MERKRLLGRAVHLASFALAFCLAGCMTWPEASREEKEDLGKRMAEASEAGKAPEAKPAGPKEMGKREGALLVTAKASENKILQGRATNIVVTLTNASRDAYVILESVTAPGTEFGYSWTRQKIGSLIHDVTSDTMDYNAIAQQVTQHPFSSGLLFPGESTTAAGSIRFLSSGMISQAIQVQYAEMSAETLSGTIYVTEGGEYYQKYRHPQVETIRNPGERAKFATMIYRDLSARHIKKSEFKLEVQPLDFDEKMAFAKAGFETDKYDYSSIHNAWLLDHGDALWLVSAQGAAAYKGLTLEAFKLIESGNTEFFCTTFPQEIYGVVLRYSPQIRPYNGYHFNIARGHIYTFAAEVAGYGYVVLKGDYPGVPRLSLGQLKAPPAGRQPGAPAPALPEGMPAVNVPR